MTIASPLTLELGPNLRLSFVRIPAGSYPVGVPSWADDPGWGDVSEEWWCELDEFLLARLLLPRLALNGSGEPPDPSAWEPAVLSWFDAVKLCRDLDRTHAEVLSRQLGVEAVLRLPTSTELEVAVSLTVGRDATASSRARQSAWVGRRRVRDVRAGQPATGTGLVDLLGNAAVWCAEPPLGGATINAHAPISPGDSYVSVVRAAYGAGWRSVSDELWPWQRGMLDGRICHDWVGVRLCVGPSMCVAGARR